MTCRKCGGPVRWVPSLQMYGHTGHLIRGHAIRVISDESTSAPGSPRSGAVAAAGRDLGSAPRGRRSPVSAG